MNKKILFSLLTFMSLNFIFAQQPFSFSGYVKDSTGNPIPNYLVHVSSDTLTGAYNFVFNTSTTTDSLGHYTSSLFTFPSNILFNFYVSVSDCNGNVQTKTIPNSVSQSNVNFTICTPSAGCIATFSYTYASNLNVINFQNLSSGNPISWLWNFGDGSTSTLQNPVHVYNTNGVFPVCLTTTNSNNCTSTYCDSIHSLPSSSLTCYPGFTCYPDSITGQLTWHFNNTSTTTYPNYQIQYLWNFGDGTTSTLQNPVHTFQAISSGVYNVCLTMNVLNSNGFIVCQQMHCQNIVTNYSTGICQNSFSYSNQNNIYTFYGQVNSNNPTTYIWDFGDGTIGNGQIVTHTYTQPSVGNAYLNVCLKTITLNNLGNTCTDTSYLTLQIQATSNTCNALFYYHADTASGLLNTIYFNNYSSSTYQNYQVNYLWNFGDGTTSNIQNPVHTFTSNPSGSYNACLTINIVDSNNLNICQNTYCQNVIAGNNQITCHNNFTYTNQGLIYNFTGTNNTNNPTIYTWNFGDGTTATGQNVTHTFAQPVPGNFGYNTCLVTITSDTNGNLCSDTSCQLININNSNTCHALFYAYIDSTGSGNLNTIHFMNQSSSSLQYTFEFLWNFGDGTTSALHNPWHTFAPNSSNNYNVCLTLTVKSSGIVVCQDNYCDLVSLNSNPNNCQNSFSYTNQNLNYQFHGFVNSNNNTSYYWNFGDGSSTNGSYVTHTFTQPTQGNIGYNVRLITITNYPALGTSCSDTTYQFVTILGNSNSCQANYTNHSDSITGINTIYFTNISVYFNANYQIQYLWNFGDGTSSTIQNPIHVFQSNPTGSYNVCLTIKLIDSLGNTICQDSYCKNIAVGVAINNCQNSFTYTNQSYNYSFSANINNNYYTVYKWDFGDGNIATGKDVNHVFIQPSSGILGYNVCLITISTYNGANCIDTTFNFVTINNSNSCNANYSYNADTSNSMNLIIFTNTSSSTFTNCQYTYTWNFGDGTSSNQQNPVHFFQPNSSGIYTVCLLIKVISNSIVICQNSYCQNVYVESLTNYCHNSFTYSNQNLLYSFMANINSQNSTNYFWNFGDGTTAIGQYVTHVFSIPPSGSNGFNVCLISTTTSNGSICIDTSCQFVSINYANGNVIQGYVYAGNNLVKDGNVEVYQANNATMSYSLVNTIALDTNGLYQFYYLNLPSTTPVFLVKASMNSTAPQFNQYAPGFYLNTLNWFTATPVFPSANSIFYNINLIQLPVNPIIGNGSFSGNVIQLGTKNSINSIPLGNVELIITDENNTPLKINYSDVNGNFNFNNLPIGNYRLHVEVTNINYTPYPFTISTLNSNNNNVLIVINNNSAVITGISDEINGKSLISEIYPNPATSEAFIEFKNATSDKVTITIFNNTGMRLVSEEFNVSDNQRININQKQLPVGIYTVKISSSNGINSFRKLIISK